MSEHRDPRPDLRRGDELDAADRRLVETLREELDPGFTPAQRAAFSQRLEERLAHRGRAPGQPLVLAASAAVAALALWLAVPAGWLGGAPPAPGEAASPGLLAFAYYETDYLDALPDDALSEEFEAIASAFEVP